MVWHHIEYVRAFQYFNFSTKRWLRLTKRDCVLAIRPACLCLLQSISPATWPHPHETISLHLLLLRGVNAVGYPRATVRYSTYHSSQYSCGCAAYIPIPRALQRKYLYLHIGQRGLEGCRKKSINPSQYMSAATHCILMALSPSRLARWTKGCAKALKRRIAISLRPCEMVKI